MLYVISLFLNQVILKNGFPFEIKLPEINTTELESLAKIIESTSGNGIVNEKKSKDIASIFNRWYRLWNCSFCN